MRPTTEPRCVFLFPSRSEDRSLLAFGEPLETLIAVKLGEVRDVLHRAERMAQQGRWVAGFVSYDAAPAFDGAFRLPGTSALPLAWFGVHDAPLAGFTAPTEGLYFAGEWKLSITRDRFHADVTAIREAIGNGDAYQVNHTARLHARFAGDDLLWFFDLCAAQQSDYCAWLDIGRHRILSLSPELFFRREGNRITARPMKGTLPRGQSAAEDERLAERLYHSEKNRAENLMIVDLIRNDLSRVALPHSVRVPALFTIERYPTVLQMTSTVTANVSPGTTLDEIFTALFPCGSVTGAPKIKAMEIISRHETRPRGIYCGAVGLIAPGGDATFNVAIRTVALDTATSEAVYGTGGGIVWDSTPEDEYDELLLKARFLHGASRPFDLIETMRLADGEYFLLERHLERLAGSAAWFGYPFDAPACRRVLQAEAERLSGAAARVRLTLSSQGVFEIRSAPLPPAVVDAEVAMADVPVSRRNLALLHKTTERSVYERALASHAGVFDVLLWNDEGELTEFTRGNLVVDVHDRRLTPPVRCGLLDGTLRRELVERGVVEEAVLRREDLGRADRLWFVNSLRGEIPVRLRAGSKAG